MHVEGGVVAELNLLDLAPELARGARRSTATTTTTTAEAGGVEMVIRIFFRVVVVTYS